MRTRIRARTQEPIQRMTFMTPQKINVLVACEESQRVCMAFRARGFRAYSCDMVKCSGKHPEWHIIGDCLVYFKTPVKFTTEDGKRHQVHHWHLIIAHPPCTYLCKVSAVQLVHDGEIDQERLKKMYAARDFFMKCLVAPADYVAIENPIPMRRAELPRPSCFIEPYWFGHKYSKKTFLWLRNLPPLLPTVTHPHPKEFVRASRGKYRSRTFPGIAEAMAQQWGDCIIDDLRSR